MDTKEIEIHVDKDNKVNLHDFIEMKIKYDEIYFEKDKEIERLNNIINELNCGIKELDDMFYETFRISQNGYYSISEWELKDFTNKLQELKGSGLDE